MQARSIDVMELGGHESQISQRSICFPVKRRCVALSRPTSYLDWSMSPWPISPYVQLFLASNGPSEVSNIAIGAWRLTNAVGGRPRVRVDPTGHGVERRRVVRSQSNQLGSFTRGAACSPCTATSPACFSRPALPGLRRGHGREQSCNGACVSVTWICEQISSGLTCGWIYIKRMHWAHWAEAQPETVRDYLLEAEADAANGWTSVHHESGIINGVKCTGSGLWRRRGRFGLLF